MSKYNEINDKEIDEIFQLEKEYGTDLPSTNIDDYITDINAFDVLCKDVGRFNSRAGRLLFEGEQVDCDEFAFSGNLYEVFDWAKSEQGFAYWENIYYEMVGRGEQPPTTVWAGKD